MYYNPSNPIEREEAEQQMKRENAQAKSQQKTGALSGAASGAMAGAAIGSVVPVIGTGVGAVLGGLAGGVMGFMGGGKKRHYKIITHYGESPFVGSTSPLSPGMKSISTPFDLISRRDESPMNIQDVLSSAKTTYGSHPFMRTLVRRQLQKSLSNYMSGVGATAQRDFTSALNAFRKNLRSQGGFTTVKETTSRPGV